MMVINTELTEGNKPAYSFDSRGVNYTVIDDQDGYYTVISERKAASFGPQLSVHTKDELKSRSKALKSLVEFIDAGMAETSVVVM